MDTITNTLSSTAIGTVFSKENLDEYLQTNNLSRKSITEFTIPNNVTEIGYHAFQDCSSLTSITIPNSVTEIGKGAFSCSNSFYPNNVTESFSGRSRLTTITIPDSVTKIGDSAFADCTSLTSITIPDSVTNIGRWAFSDCTSLTSITIPNSVTEISQGTFMGCTSLTAINIPDSVTEIGDYAFNECSDLAYINIPAGVTKIGDHAFWKCTSLENINIPDGAKRIGMGSFSECSSLTSINIPYGVTKIGNGAFWKCSSLQSIVIPNDIILIGSKAFNGCTSLTSFRCHKSEQFDWDYIGVNRTQTQIISHQEYLTNNHADIITAIKITGLNNNEAYLISRMISEPEFNPSVKALKTAFYARTHEQVRELLIGLNKTIDHLPMNADEDCLISFMTSEPKFNPSWEELETTFNERSFEQIRKLLKWLNKTIDHLPEIEIGITTSSDPKYNITHQLSPFLTIADRNSLFGPAERTIDIRPREQAPAAHHQFSRGV